MGTDSYCVKLKQGFCWEIRPRVRGTSFDSAQDDVRTSAAHGKSFFGFLSENRQHPSTGSGWLSKWVRFVIFYFLHNILCSDFEIMARIYLYKVTVVILQVIRCKIVNCQGWLFESNDRFFDSHGTLFAQDTVGTRQKRPPTEMTLVKVDLNKNDWQTSNRVLAFFRWIIRLDWLLKL